ncbi:hypothetical protein CsSME_00017756 [Camellia sinensis var. sinensis]
MGSRWFAVGRMPRGPIHVRYKEGKLWPHDGFREDKLCRSDLLCRERKWSQSVKKGVMPTMQFR